MIVKTGYTVDPQIYIKVNLFDRRSSELDCRPSQFYYNLTTTVFDD
jgi:hypothetical protein